MDEIRKHVESIKDEVNLVSESISSLLVRSNSGEVRPVELRIVVDDSREELSLVALTLKLDGETIGRGTSRTGDDFEALKEVRQSIEKEGLLLNCYGSSLNVHPVPMTRVGVFAYKLTHGKPVSLFDRVHIYETGSDVTPTTVKKQEAFYRKWLLSLDSKNS